MKIWDNSFKSSNKKSACFGPDEIKSIEETKKITKHLDIPFHIIDVSKEYVSNVINYFKDEYISGKTPNPCIKCNQKIKFYYLLEKAKETGLTFDYFATGHYAKIEFNNKLNRYLLKKGIDQTKDQSYFLALLKQDQLSQINFPLGNYTKIEIKALSKKIGFKLHEKRESQDFYSGDYIELIDNIPDAGDIVDKDGNIFGRHKGICFYTIGQRKGLGISYKEPLYVTKIDTLKNKIIVGTESELYKTQLIVKNINWISIKDLSNELRAKVRIRYMHKEDNAIINPYEKDKAIIKFDKPQRAIAPGQFAVFYNSDIVIGGGFIDEVIS
jgi:tRNA-specific 2-thiouridylase